MRQPNDVVRKQIENSEAIQERIPGGPMSRLVRPPDGAPDRRVRRIAAELGYRSTVMWNVQPHDRSSKTTASRTVTRATGARRGSIILLHCRFGGPR